MVLYPAVSAGSADYALGIDTSTLWSGVPTTAEFFRWYGGTTLAATLSGTGNLTLVGDLAVNGGDITTTQTTFNLVDATATTVNFARAATALTMGAATGSTTVRNNLTVTGNLTVQGTTTQVNSTVTNVSDPIFTIGTGPLGADPVADDNRDRGIAFKWHNGTAAQTGFFGYDDSTGFMTFVPSATLANEVVSGTKGAIDVNLAGGTAQSLVYQSAANTTAFLAAGTSGHILQTNGTGSAPSWVPTSGLSAGTADTVKTVARSISGDYYPTFVDSNNATATGEVVYTTSSFVINPSTGNVGIGATPVGPLHINTRAGSSDANTVIIQRPASTDYSGITFRTASTTDWSIGHNSNGGFSIFEAGSAATTRMIVKAGGNVGIGTTAPAFSGGSGLEIQRAGTATLRLDSGSFATEFRAQTNGTEIYQLSAGYLDLGTSATTRVRVTSAGDVGIGVTAPSKRLQVDSGATATGGQAWSHSAGTVYARLGVVNPGVSNDTEFGTVSNNNLRFLTVNAERAQIDTAGNLLVNLTAAGTNGRLQVAGSIGLSGNTQIRQVSNADGNTLQVFATQFVAAATNSGSIGYTGGGLIASVSAAASQILLDVGGQTAGHRLRVTNGGDGIQGRLAYSNFGVERFAVDSTTGTTYVYTNTNATSTITGALQVVGGAGFGGNVYVGGSINVPVASANIILGDNALASAGSPQIVLGRGSTGDSNLIGANKGVRYGGVGTGLEILANGSGAIDLATYNGNWGVTGYGIALRVRNDRIVQMFGNVNASSTNTGALQVVGGVGISQDLFVGGTIFGAVSGSAGSATNAANVAVTNDNATTTDQYVTFVNGSSGNLPIKVSAATGLVWKPNTGSLGLGISPSSRLHVDASTAGGGAIFSRQGFNYATVSQLGSSADAIFGGGVIASATNAQVRKTVADVAHFIKLQITDGISFHTNITGSAGASVDRATNERMRINSNGNVGIGTADPLALLQIGAKTVENTFNNSRLILSHGASAEAPANGNPTSVPSIGVEFNRYWQGGNDTNRNMGGIYGYGVANWGSGIYMSTRPTGTGGTPAIRMVVNHFGDVGIGTLTPGTRLAVQSSGANGIALLQDTGATTNSGRLFFQASGGTFALTNVGNTLQFASGATVGSDTGTGRMVLNASGFLGVGTTQVPLTYLDVRHNNAGTQAPVVSGITLRTANGHGMEWHMQHTNGYQGWVAAARVGANSSTFGTGFLEFITAGSSGGNQVSVMALHGNGNVSVGSTAVTDYKLFVNGSFAATTKSFVIDHPTKAGHKLRYGSLEGPENGVYVRGRLKDNNVIELPDYWTGLVDEDSITVDLTPVGKHQKLYVEDIAANTVTVGTESDQPINCFYTVWAERKDVDKLVVEYKEQEI
jgi:hypothetical protein